MSLLILLFFHLFPSSFLFSSLIFYFLSSSIFFLTLLFFHAPTFSSSFISCLPLFSDISCLPPLFFFNLSPISTYPLLFFLTSTLFHLLHPLLFYFFSTRYGPIFSLYLLIIYLLSISFFHFSFASTVIAWPLLFILPTLPFILSPPRSSVQFFFLFLHIVYNHVSLHFSSTISTLLRLPFVFTRLHRFYSHFLPILLFLILQSFLVRHLFIRL